METNDNITDENRLLELGGSNCEIADDEPDIIGWDVRNSQGKKIGEVDELLFDPQSRSVRYLVVDLDDNELDLENDDRRVLIPIGLAELYRDDVDDDDRDVNDDKGTSFRRTDEKELHSDDDEDIEDDDQPEFAR